MESRLQQLEAELAQMRAAANASGVPTRQHIAQARLAHQTQLRQLLAKEGATDAVATQVLTNILRIAANVGPAADYHVSALLELLGAWLCSMKEEQEEEMLILL